MNVMKKNEENEQEKEWMDDKQLNESMLLLLTNAIVNFNKTEIKFNIKWEKSTGIRKVVLPLLTAKLNRNIFFFHYKHEITQIKQVQLKTNSEY